MSVTAVCPVATVSDWPRSTIVTSLVSLCLNRQDELDDTGLSAFGEAFAAAIGPASDDVRSQAVDGLCALRRVPRAAVNALIARDGTLAARLMRDAIGLSLADMVSLAATVPEPLAIALAGRRALPEQVAGVLTLRQESAIAAAVLGNAGASVSRSTLTTLVELAYSDRTLMRALTNRVALPAAILDRLWPYLPLELKILALVRTPTVDNAGFAAIKRQMEAERDEQARCGDVVPGLDSLRGDVACGARTADEIVIRLAGEGRIVECAEYLAELAGTPVVVAAHALLSPQDRALALVARKARIDESATTALIALRTRSGVTCRSARDTLRLFASLSADDVDETVAGLTAHFQAGVTPGRVVSVPPAHLVDRTTDRRKSRRAA